MGWVYEYYCERLKVTFKQGDALIVKGKGYQNSGPESPVGYNYTNEPTEKRFYGVYVNEQYPEAVAYPICCQNADGSGKYFFTDASIYQNISGTVDTYTLTINPNGGIWNGTTGKSTIKQSYKSTKELENPVRDGYRFIGWTKSGSGTLDNTTFTYGAGNCTLTANWVAIYYFDLNIYLNDVLQSNVNVCHADIYIDNSVVATNVGDYYKQHDKGSKWEVKDITVDSNYAVYKTSVNSGIIETKTTYNIYVGQKYTVIYNANGGSGGTSQTVNYGTSWKAKGAICTRRGYVQIGWNTKADGSGTAYRLNETQTNKQSSNLTLYAIWEKITSIGVYADGEWKDGFPYIYTNGKWRELMVGVYVNKSWKE